MAGLYDDYVCGVQALAEALNKARDEAGPKIADALVKWVRATEQDARSILGRPRWALQRSISSKVKEYEKDRKVWAMAGFRFREKDPRDPGVYGKYHEGGYAPDRRVVKVPDHFLRQAKQKNVATLEKECKAACAEFAKRVAEIMREERAKSKAK